MLTPRVYHGVMPNKLTARQADKLIESAQNAVTFTVEGSSPFPIDMLRYDLCWPAKADDAAWIPRSGSGRHINLKGLKTPTIGRWESFGWKVVG